MTRGARYHAFSGRQPYALSESPRIRKGALALGIEVTEQHRTSFMDRVRIDPMTDCWSRDRAQTIVNVDHSPQQAAWRLYKGGIVPRFMMTTCDEPACCNPWHLIGSDWVCAMGHPRAREYQIITTKAGRECWICVICHNERWSKCIAGHDMTSDDPYYVKVQQTSHGPVRVCMECQRRRSRESYERRKEDVRAMKRRHRAENTESYQRDLARKRQRYAEWKATATIEERAARARQHAFWKAMRKQEREAS